MGNTFTFGAKPVPAKGSERRGRDGTAGPGERHNSEWEASGAAPPSPPSPAAAPAAHRGLRPGSPPGRTRRAPARGPIQSSAATAEAALPAPRSPRPGGGAEPRGAGPGLALTHFVGQPVRHGGAAGPASKRRQQERPACFK